MEFGRGILVPKRAVCANFHCYSGIFMPFMSVNAILWIGPCMTDRVKYGLITTKFGRGILVPKKVVSANFHCYSSIFMPFMSFNAILWIGPSITARRNRGPILPIFNTKQTASIGNICAKFQLPSSFRLVYIVFSTDGQTDDGHG